MSVPKKRSAETSSSQRKAKVPKQNDDEDIDIPALAGQKKVSFGINLAM